MRRYQLKQEFPSGMVSMDPNRAGRWVEYDEAFRCIDDLEAQLLEERQQLKKAEQLLKEAQAALIEASAELEQAKDQLLLYTGGGHASA